MILTKATKEPVSVLRRRFAERVKARRIELGLTQSEVAARMGSTQPYYNNIERGAFATTVDTVERLADALGLKPRELFPD